MASAVKISSSLSARKTIINQPKQTKGNAEAQARRVCQLIAWNGRQAICGKNSQAFSSKVKSLSNDLKGLSPTSVYGKLAVKLHKETDSFISSKQRKVEAVPTTFKAGDAASIEKGLQAAYRSSLMNKNANTIQKCLAAAKTAILAIPASKAGQKNELIARHNVVSYLVQYPFGKKTSTATQANKAQSPVTVASIAKNVITHPVTKLLSLAVVGNFFASSIFHSLAPDLLPAWSKYFTVQQILGLNTAAPQTIINSVSSSTGVASSSTGVAMSSTGVASSSTGVAMSSTGVASSSTGVAMSSTGIASSSTGVALSSTGVSAPVTAAAGYSFTTIALGTLGIAAGIVAINSAIHHFKPDLLPEWTRNFAIQGIKDMVESCAQTQDDETEAPEDDVKPELGLQQQTQTLTPAPQTNAAEKKTQDIETGWANDHDDPVHVPYEPPQVQSKPTDGWST